MAQVITHYIGTAKANIYVYPGTDGTQSGTQVAKGTRVYLYADSSGNIIYENGLARTYNPVEGWVNAANLSDITPIYKTITDKCTAPTSVTLNTSTKVLTITGGNGGDLNTFQGYQVRWRDAAIGTTSYGSWSSPVTVSSSSTTATYTVTAPAGKVRQFQVRTIGSAGESYYSAYVTVSATLTGNTAPGSPSFVRPAANAVSMSQTPVMVVSVPADADGDTLTLKRQIDSGGWVNVQAMKSGTVYDKLPTLASGSHTVRYKLADAYAEGGAVSRMFTVSPASWGRTIETGTVISNKMISHRVDINELLSVVNAQRVFYGLGAVTLPGMVGRFGDWQRQMEYLAEAINQSKTEAGQATVQMSIPGYPTASVFNMLREYATEI